MSRSTLVFVHAHPDDESVLTGATLAKAHSLGYRTVVLYGTRGDAGETGADLGDESLGDRRVREAQAACEELGVDRIEWLPYDDSGMAGTQTTGNAKAFCNADLTEMSTRASARLANELVLAVVGYDSNGTYGHPDHLQVHALAHALAPLLGAEWVLDATYSREYLATLPGSDGSLDPTFAAADADLTHFVQGEEWFRAKLAALGHHLSQVPDDWDANKPGVSGFRSRFGTEWFITRSLNGRSELGDLAQLFQAKADWPGPPSADSA